jgi:hypothetical protein
MAKISAVGSQDKRSAWRTRAHGVTDKRARFSDSGPTARSIGENHVWQSEVDLGLTESRRDADRTLVDRARGRNNRARGRPLRLVANQQASTWLTQLIGAYFLTNSGFGIYTGFSGSGPPGEQPFRLLVSMVGLVAGLLAIAQPLLGTIDTLPSITILGVGLCCSPGLSTSSV